jgi:hypothetical protein
MAAPGKSPEASAAAAISFRVIGRLSDARYTARFAAVRWNKAYQLRYKDHAPYIKSIHPTFIKGRDHGLGRVAVVDEVDQLVGGGEGLLPCSSSGSSLAVR